MRLSTVAATALLGAGITAGVAAIWAGYVRARRERRVSSASGQPDTAETSQRAPRRLTRGLVVGDSIVATPVLTRALQQFTGFPWDNSAVAGRNSEQIVGQVQRALRRGVHDVLLVSVGANDGNRSLDGTQRNVRSIVETARGRGATVVVLTEPPLRSYRGMGHSIQSQQAVARSEASRQWVLGGGSGADFVVDLHRVLGGGSARLRPDLDSGDGVHPNTTGREAIAQAVARIIA